MIFAMRSVLSAVIRSLPPATCNRNAVLPMLHTHSCTHTHAHAHTHTHTHTRTHTHTHTDTHTQTHTLGVHAWRVANSMFALPTPNLYKDTHGCRRAHARTH